MMSQPVTLRFPNSDDLSALYRLRHDVYAAELGQYSRRDDAILPDRDDVQSQYIVACDGDNVVGFVGVTPPTSPSFSITHYVNPGVLPFPLDGTVYELRALTVAADHRGSQLPMALLYAAFRFIQHDGGQTVLAMGRQEMVPMYRRLGMKEMGFQFTTSGVTYSILAAGISEIEVAIAEHTAIRNRIAQHIEWKLDFPYRKSALCYHGGDFFKAIGEQFDNIDRRHDVISADVLDALFPPSPKVAAALHEHLDWVVSTSPPNHAEGLVAKIAEVRGVSQACILTGAGSSQLIFLAFREWLSAGSRVLLLDPTYGEYAHVLEQLVGCQIDRFTLSPENGFRINGKALSLQLQSGYDLFVWVNPNSPTGVHYPCSELQDVLAACPAKTRVWIDETYVEYAGVDQSLERYAAQSQNVVVCKSMSKMYALSGVRVAYLCAPTSVVDSLRPLQPPWTISLPAQLAAVRALEDPEYYRERYRETVELRTELCEALTALGLGEVHAGITNCALIRLAHGIDKAALLEACRERGLFLRDVANMGSMFDTHWIRIAVKDADTNRRMIDIIRACM